METQEYRRCKELIEQINETEQCLEKLKDLFKYHSHKLSGRDFLMLAKETGYKE